MRPNPNMTLLLLMLDEVFAASQRGPGGGPRRAIVRPLRPFFTSVFGVEGALALDSLARAIVSKAGFPQ